MLRRILGDASVKQHLQQDVADFFAKLVGRMLSSNTTSAPAAFRASTAFMNISRVSGFSGVFAAVKAQQAGCHYVRAS